MPSDVAQLTAPCLLPRVRRKGYTTHLGCGTIPPKKILGLNSLQLDTLNKEQTAWELNKRQMEFTRTTYHENDLGKCDGSQNQEVYPVKACSKVLDRDIEATKATEQLGRGVGRQNTATLGQEHEESSQQASLSGFSHKNPLITAS